MNSKEKLKASKQAKWLIQNTEVDLAIAERDRVWVIRRILNNQNERGVIYKLINKGEL